MTDKNTKISILGGGSWGTAIVKILTENLPKVCWYVRNEETVEFIKKNKHNPRYITDIEFNTEQLVLTSDINEAVECADILVLVIPSAFVHSELSNLKKSISDKTIFSAVKGIIPEYGVVVGEYLNQCHQIPFSQIGIIAGPCHAEEVALERLSYLTISCSDKEKAVKMAEMIACPFIKTKISKDIIGIEYATMLKNIYAIASGIAHGLGYGDNFQSVLMSNAIRETQRYIKRIKKTKRNVKHSAYLGDLLVTGYSLFSRNRTLGTMLGKGYTIKSAIMEMNMIAEGYYATQSAYKIIRSKEKKTRTPILDTVYNILYEGKNPKREFLKLTDKLN